MKVFYMNDEQKPITVRVMGSDYDGVLMRGNQYHTLGPAEAKVFEFAAPDKAIPYIKKWKDMVLISYIEAANLPQTPQGA